MKPLAFHIVFPTDDGTNRTMSIAFGVRGQGAAVMQRNSPEGPDWFDLALDQIENELASAFGAHERTIINDAEAMTVLYRCMELHGEDDQEDLAAEWCDSLADLCGEENVTDLVSFYQQPNDPPLIGRPLFDHVLTELGLIERVDLATLPESAHMKVGSQGNQRRAVEKFYAQTCEEIEKELLEGGKIPEPRVLGAFFADRLDGSYASDKRGHFTHDLWVVFSRFLAYHGLTGSISTTIRHGTQAEVVSTLSFSRLPEQAPVTRPTVMAEPEVRQLDPVAELLGHDLY